MDEQKTVVVDGLPELVLTVEKGLITLGDIQLKPKQVAKVIKALRESKKLHQANFGRKRKPAAVPPVEEQHGDPVASDPVP